MNAELEPTPARSISPFEMLADQFQAWRERTAEADQRPLLHTFLPISDGQAIAISMAGQRHNSDRSIYEIGKLTVLEHNPDTTAPRMLLEMRPMFDWSGNLVGLDEGRVITWKEGQNGQTSMFIYHVRDEQGIKNAFLKDKSDSIGQPLEINWVSQLKRYLNQANRALQGNFTLTPQG